MGGEVNGGYAAGMANGDDAGMSFEGPVSGAIADTLFAVWSPTPMPPERQLPLNCETIIGCGQKNKTNKQMWAAMY
jgi:hypothetical protein